MRRAEARHDESAALVEREDMRLSRAAMAMTSSNIWQRRRIPRRIFWSLLASIAINAILWVAVYHPLAFPHDVQKKAMNVPTIRIEHRIAPRRRARPKPHLFARPQAKTKPQQHLLVQTKPQVFVRPQVRTTPSALRHPRAQSTPREAPWSGHLSFTPHQSAALKLPATWATQDNGNAAAASTTVWVDFKHARGAFVPKVMLWHTNAAYLSGPTLDNAIHDIVASLRQDGAKISVSEAHPVCGGKRMGWFIAYKEPNTDPPWQFEDTLYMAGDTVYRATYSRPDGAPEDPATRAALATLCPAP